MAESEWPPVAELLPHAGNMIFLTEVLEHDETSTVCGVRISAEDILADSDGEVGCWAGLEYMAQSIATHSGLVGRANGEPPRVGFLLGSRRVHFQRARYHAGQSLRVRVTRLWGKESGMVSFECSIEDADTREPLADARLNCFLPEPGFRFGQDPVDLGGA